MSNVNPTTVFVIRENITGQLIKFGAKCGWASVGAAKNAFNLHMITHYGKDWSEGKGLFDSQDQFVIEEIK
ncbi:hypothetical protein [Pseudomonas phage vB_PsaM_M1]|nr:hypothetical protein [Pseudomonas phage vB_PsaM_M1]